MAYCIKQNNKYIINFHLVYISVTFLISKYHYNNRYPLVNIEFNSEKNKCWDYKSS